MRSCLDLKQPFSKLLVVTRIRQSSVCTSSAFVRANQSNFIVSFHISIPLFSLCSWMHAAIPYFYLWRVVFQTGHLDRLRFLTAPV